MERACWCCGGIVSSVLRGDGHSRPESTCWGLALWALAVGVQQGKGHLRLKGTFLGPPRPPTHGGHSGAPQPGSGSRKAVLTSHSPADWQDASFRKSRPD